MGVGGRQKGNHVTGATTATSPASTENLLAAQTFFFDLDGCLWFGDNLASGAVELVSTLRSAGRHVCFVSNVTGTTAALVADKLTRLGIPANEADVQTPFSILPLHPLVRSHRPAFVLGNQVIRDAMQSVGLELTDDPDEAQLVIASRDTDLCYRDLVAASQPLYRGAPLLALNLDARVPVSEGTYVPGNGAIVAALATATGAQVEAIGKPAAFFFDQALERFDAQRSSTVMIGDTIDSDIKGGEAAGLLTVHVGPNNHSLEKNPAIPDFSVADLLELRELLQV